MWVNKTSCENIDKTLINAESKYEINEILQYFKAKYQALNYFGKPLHLGILVLFHLNIQMSYR